MRQYLRIHISPLNGVSSNLMVDYATKVSVLASKIATVIRKFSIVGCILICVTVLSCQKKNTNRMFKGYFRQGVFDLFEIKVHLKIHVSNILQQWLMLIWDICKGWYIHYVPYIICPLSIYQLLVDTYCFCNVFEQNTQLNLNNSDLRLKSPSIAVST